MQTKWYLKPVTVIIAVLCVGPLALPLVWISPAFSKKLKIAITLVMVILTILLLKASVDLYNILLKEIEELRNIST
jgi:hypothetical protein